MNSTIPKIKDKNKALIYALSFGLPFMCMGIIYAIFGVFPFGDRTALVMDLSGQYADFFAFYHRVLTGGDSIFYSFTKEMGGNVFGLFAYYLSSPFFLLALFFPTSAMPDAIALITMLKIGCSGLTFAIFLRHVFKKSDLSVVLFSCAYALMTYSMHYAMCIMWLDGAIWLPIIIIGVEKILNNKSGWLFLFAYAMTLFSNYYTAYMSTFFVVLYFFYRYFSGDNEKNIKDFLIKIAKIAALGIVGVLLAMVVLYPTFLDIFNGKMASGSYVADGFWNIDISNIPRRLFIGQYDSIRNNGNPNIFCGMLCGVSLGVFFFNPKIKPKAKIATLIMFIIFFTSFFIKRVDMAWHIFQYPNWYPYRYAYTFCFFSVMTAFSGFTAMNKEKRNFTFAGIAAYVLLLLYVWIFKRDVLTNRTLAIVSFIFVAVYIAGLFILQSGTQKIKSYVYAGLILITCSELVLNGYYTISGLNGEYEYKSRSEYSQKVKSISGMVDFLKEYDDGLYREEKTFSRTDNDAMTFGYNGMTHYSSTYNNNMLRLNARMGMLQEYVLIRYMGSTILTDSLLGVKYVASESLLNDDYTEINSIDNYSIYENPYALPFGFAANEEALNEPAYGSSASENQGLFAKSLLGDSFVHQVQFNSLSSSNDELEFVAPENGTYYWDLRQKYEGNIELTVNGASVNYQYDTNDKKIYCLGKYNRGDKVHVKLASSTSLKETQVFSIDTDGFGKACMQKNNGHTLNITNYGNTWLEGTINLDSNEILFTTIPYEKGWTAYVDGKKTEILSAQNAFIAVRAGEGEHTVKLRYTVPGFMPSLIVSIVTLIGILFVASKRKNAVNMINIIKKLWHMFSNVLYKITSAVLGIFNISIPEDKWAAFMQFVKFGIVGVSNTFVDYFSYLIALGIFNHFNLFGDKAYIPSNVVGLCVSVSNAFYWNNKYVFKKKEGQERSGIRAFLKTFSSYAITGLGVKTILLYVFITLIGIPDTIAPIIIMFIVVPINFLMNKLWAFK